MRLLFRQRAAWGAIFLVVLAAGCAGTLPSVTGDESSGIQTLRDWYGQGDYLHVVLGVGEFLGAHPGSKYVDEARYLLARSNYEQGNYLEAEDQFRRLLRDFPDSDFAEVSSYYLGLALLSQSRSAALDQEETNAAHIQFRTFLREYPNSKYAERAQKHIAEIRDKLAEKAYRNGITYLKSHSWKAARYYFEDKVYRAYPESKWAPRALLKLAESYRKTRDWSKVLEWVGRLQADYPKSPEAAAVEKLKDRASRELDAAPPREDTPTADGGNAASPPGS